MIAVDGQDQFEGVAGIIFTAIQAVNSQKHPSRRKSFGHIQRKTVFGTMIPSFNLELSMNDTTILKQ